MQDSPLQPAHAYAIVQPEGAFQLISCSRGRGAGGGRGAGNGRKMEGLVSKACTNVLLGIMNSFFITKTETY